MAVTAFVKAAAMVFELFFLIIALAFSALVAGPIVTAGVLGCSPGWSPFWWKKDMWLSPISFSCPSWTGREPLFSLMMRCVFSR